MQHRNDRRPHWRVSSVSGGGNCVEVAVVEHGVLVRDSKSPNAVVLAFPAEAWMTFVRHLRSNPTGDRH